MFRIRAWGVFSALLFVLLLFPGKQANAETLRVNPAWINENDGGNAFSSISDAVRSAQPGDEIVLSEGVYQEPLEQFPIEIDRPLRIRAEADGGAVIDGPAFQAVIKITAPDVSMRGLDIRFRRWGVAVFADNVELIDNRFTLADTAYRVSSCGVWLAGAYNATLQGNAFTHCGLCIAGPTLSESSRGKPVLTGLFEVGEDPALFSSHCLEDNTVNGKPLIYMVDQADIAFSDEAGQVIVACSQDVEISGMDVSDNSIGLTVAHCERVRVTDVKADRCGIFGIYLAYVKSGSMEDSSSTQSNHGIDIRFVQGVFLRGCVTDACEQGIFLSWARECLVVDCEMNGGGRGLFLAGGQNNHATRCAVRENENGICTEGEKELLLSNNVITGNTVAGIRLLRGDTICVSNTLQENWTGMIVSDADYLTLSENSFVGNVSCALYLREVPEGQIVLNRFEGTTETYTVADGEMEEGSWALNVFENAH